MSGYDDLERQLRASVRERGEAREPAPARRRPWWRRRPLVLIALPVVLVAGVATAATQIGGSRSVGYRADRLAMSVMRKAGLQDACRPNRPGRLSPVVDDGAGPRVTRVLPELGAAPAVAPVPDLVTMARRQSGEALLGRTLRTITFPGGIDVVLFVSRGAGVGGFSDPVGCSRAARQALAARRAGTEPAVYAATERLLRRAFASPAARETLHVGVGITNTLGRGHGWAVGAEGRFPPTRALRTGVWVGGGSRGHASLFVGIVRPDVALVRIGPAAGTKTRAHRVAHPRQGVFVFTLPRRHGAMVIRQYVADGRYLRSDPMR